MIFQKYNQHLKGKKLLKTHLFLNQIFDSYILKVNCFVSVSNGFKISYFHIKEKKLEETKRITKREIEEWRGDLEQIDDICVMGVRI